MLENYLTEYADQIYKNYNQIPLEARIYCYLLSHLHIQNVDDLIIAFTNTNILNPDGTGRTYLEISDINFMYNRYGFIKFLLKTHYNEFIEMCINSINTGLNKNIILEYIGLRFTTIGFLNVLWGVIANNNSLIKELPTLKYAVEHFIITGNTNKFGTSVFNKFVKFYYNTLLMPYRVKSNNPITYLQVIINHDFAKEFEELFTKIVPLQPLSRPIGSRFLIPQGQSQAIPQQGPQPQPQAPPPVQPTEIIPLSESLQLPLSMRQRLNQAIGRGKKRPLSRKNRRSKN
jgi:hypothetical protein